MHIDQDKLMDLISDASGISRDNVEKQISELVEEINQALEDGEAYEIDDFGVFSAMGNNVIFIPADNLETEINYKYVGMEAIEVEDTAAQEEEGEDEVPDEMDSDPFAGLLGDVSDEDDDEEEADVFEEYILEEDEDDESEIEETVAEEAEEAEEEDEDIFDIGENTDELIPENAPGPEKWGIDTYKDDTAEGVFSGMMGESSEEEDEDESEAELISSGSASDSDDVYAEESLLGGEEDFDEEFDDPFAELAKSARSKSEKEERPEVIAGPSEEDEGTDADVFAGLDDLEDLDDEDDDGDDSDESAAEATEDSEDYVPVVANVSSDKKPEKEKKKEEPEKKPKEKEYKPRSRSKKDSKQGSPSLLLVVIVILIGAGITYGLAYFGVVNIEGITPQNQQVQLAQQNNTPPAVNEQQSEDPAQTEAGMNAEAEAATPPTQDEEAAPSAAETNTAAAETNPPETTSNQNEQSNTETELPSVAEVDQDRFGLMGQAVAEANSGYTIVLYTLTNQDNAEREYERLSSIGFRTLMQQRQNSSYGTVYRLSIGQFSTLTDAAIAAEDIGDGIPENYIISRIN